MFKFYLLKLLTSTCSPWLQGSPENIFVQALQNHLLPSHTYSHVSGGLPINILDLTVSPALVAHLKEIKSHLIFGSQAIGEFADLIVRTLTMISANMLVRHYQSCQSSQISYSHLQWEALRQFHSSHYHPTNARFFTYGDMPLDNHLQFIDGNVLSSFDHGSPSLSVPLEKRWSQPVGGWGTSCCLLCLYCYYILLSGLKR